MKAKLLAVMLSPSDIAEWRDGVIASFSDVNRVNRLLHGHPRWVRLQQACCETLEQEANRWECYCGNINHRGWACTCGEGEQHIDLPDGTDAADGG